MRLRLNRQSSVSLMANYWWSTVVAVIATLVLAFFLTYKLGTLTPGFSAQEITQRTESALLVRNRNPLFIVQNGLQKIPQHLKHYGPVAMRTPGMIIAGVVIYCFYNVLIRWYAKRTALLGTLILVTSSWFLHTSRLAVHDVSYLMLFVLFAAAMWLQRAHTSRLAAASCLVISSLVLYIPGMVWFIIPLIIWQHKRVKKTLTTFALWQIAGLVLVILAVCSPLIAALAARQELLTVWLGFPEQLPAAKEYARNVLQIPYQLFWRGPADPTRWLGRLPLLDWFQVIMFVFGLYSYRFKLGLDRTWFLIYTLLIGSLLVALKGPVTISLLLPFIYLIIAGGIGLMLQQWFTVFPRNPFARSVGMVILSLALIMSCAYNLSHYFIAWPRTPETKAAFQHQP